MKTRKTWNSRLGKWVADSTYAKINTFTGKPKPQHTPTPWKAHGTEFGVQVDSQNFLEIGSTCNLIPEPECRANAAFIVKAVNQHEALLASHEEMLDILKGIINATGKIIGGQEYGLVIHKYDATYQKIQQVIAKAEGEGK